MGLFRLEFPTSFKKNIHLYSSSNPAYILDYCVLEKNHIEGDLIGLEILTPIWERWLALNGHFYTRNLTL